MEKISRILKGVNSDNEIRFQEDNTMRDSLNGTIISVGHDRFSWRPMGSTRLVFSLEANFKLYGHCRIRTRLFILCYNAVSDTTRLYEVNHFTTPVTLESRWSTPGNLFNLSEDHPIRSMIGFYETPDIQRIYFTDYYNQPRVINVGRQSVVIVNPKFTEFTPDINHVFGKMTLQAIITGGSLPAGNYFFTWQYYTGDGYYTDWSALSAPVQLTGDTPAYGSLFEYQRMQGQAPDYNTTKAIKIKISPIDTDYRSIRVAAFYSSDYNSAQPGVIFFDGDISNQDKEVVYHGGENAGTITIDDLTNHSVVIGRVKEMQLASKMNVIAAMEERAELDLTTLSGGRNDQMRVTIKAENYEVPLDVTGTNITGDTNNEMALFSSPHVTYDSIRGLIRGGVWYKATTDVLWTDSAGGSHQELAGTRFRPTKPGEATSGTFVPLIRRKLYRIGPDSTNPDDPYTPPDPEAPALLVSELKFTFKGVLPADPQLVFAFAAVNKLYMVVYTYQGRDLTQQERDNMIMQISQGSTYAPENIRWATVGGDPVGTMMYNLIHNYLWTNGLQADYINNSTQSEAIVTAKLGGTFYDFVIKHSNSTFVNTSSVRNYG